MNCPVCGSEMAEDANFCTKCGSPMSKISPGENFQICKKCGYHLEKTAKFCIKCGAPAETGPSKQVETKENNATEEVTPPKAVTVSSTSKAHEHFPWQKSNVTVTAKPEGVINKLKNQLSFSSLCLAVATIMDTVFFIICLVAGIKTLVKLGQYLSYVNGHSSSFERYSGYNGYYYYGSYQDYSSLPIDPSLATIKFVVTIVLFVILAGCIALNAYLTVRFFLFSRRIDRVPMDITKIFTKNANWISLGAFVNFALIIFSIFDLVLNAIIISCTTGYYDFSFGIHGGSIALCVFMIIAGIIGSIGTVMLYSTKKHLNTEEPIKD